MPKFVTKLAVRVMPQCALAVAIVVPATLSGMPARAQESVGILGLLSRFAPQPFPAIPPPAPLPPAVLIAPPDPAAIQAPIATAGKSSEPAPRAEKVPKAQARSDPARRDPPRPDPTKPRIRPVVAHVAPVRSRTPLRAKDPSQVENPVPGLLSDRTLRAGDMAMFPDALRVFTGRPGSSHGLSDFAPLTRGGSALPSSIRRFAAGLRPGWNNAWSLAGLESAVRVAPALAGGLRQRKAVGTTVEGGPAQRPPALAAPTTASGPEPEGPGTKAAASGTAEGTPGAKVASATVNGVMQQEDGPSTPEGLPRLRGCPGGARSGDAPHLREAFTCAPARDREDATAPAGAALAQLAHATSALDH